MGYYKSSTPMTHKHNEPIGRYAVRLDMAAGKIRLQSQEALGGIPKL